MKKLISVKKFIIAAALILCVLAANLLCSCSFFKWLSDDWLTKDQKEITDGAMRRICSAIEKRDAAAVKAEFSADEISEVEDFDGQIAALLDYVAGSNLTYTRVASGSDGGAIGGYPREREFGGVRYSVQTSTDSYKVIFGYRSYYSEKEGQQTKEKIGFKYFDIINVKNDRECGDRLYTGCPFGYKGINLNYKTNYIFCPEEYGCKIAYCEKSAAFEPIIINSVEALDAFYSAHKDEYTLEQREDGKGYKDMVTVYDGAFFENHSLYVFGAFSEGGGYEYSLQFVYVGDFVLVKVVAFAYDKVYGEYEGEFTVNGVIKFIELPEKVEDGIKVILDLSYFTY